MSDHISASMKSVLKGAVIITAGTVFSTIAAFASKMIISRMSSPSTFGIFSLCFSLVSLIYIFSTLGLSVGVARYIAFFRGKADENRARDASIAALQTGILISVLIFVISVLFAGDLIAEKFYPRINGLPFLLEVIFVSIPFYAFLELAVGIGRGHGDALPKIYMMDVLRNGLFVLLLVISIPFSFTIDSIVFAYVLSVAVPSLASYYYLSREYNVNIGGRKMELALTGDMIRFSLPLAVMPVMWLVLASMDTVMLGYYESAHDVGIYNASVTLARVFNTITIPIMFMFLPIATQFFARESVGEMSILYKIITKWIFSISIPVFMILMIFPEMLIVRIFGEEYASGAVCLRIIVLGYLPSIILGINNVALTASGKSILQMWISLFTISVNVLLNVVLIPRYGLNGAALATAISFTAFNLVASVKLYQHSRIQPFSFDYFKSILAAAIPLALLFIMSGIIEINLYMVPVFVLVYLVLYFILLFLFRCVNKYDLLMLDILEKKTGKQFVTIRKIMSKAISV